MTQTKRPPKNPERFIARISVALDECLAMNSVRRKIHPKRLIENLCRFSEEVKRSALADKVNPEIFDCVNALMERALGRPRLQLTADEIQIAHEILRYLIAIKGSDHVHLPPPIDFSRPAFKAPWIRSKLRKNCLVK